MERNKTPDCDRTERLEKISRIVVYAKREREAKERRARAENSVWNDGILVRRKH